MNSRSDRSAACLRVALSATANAIEIGARCTKPSTINALIVDYYVARTGQV
jgi:hypothetical protein